MLHKIGIDPGFGGFKAAEVRDGKIYVDVLPSVVGVGERGVDHGRLGAGLGRGGKRVDKPSVVAFGGVTYLVGPNIHEHARPIERMDFLRLNDGPELRALFYTSLGRILSEQDEMAQVALLIGLPVEILQDKSQAQSTLYALRSWLVGDHQFSVDDQPMNITITQVKAAAQPLAAYFSWGLNLRGKWGRDTADLKAPVAIADPGFNTFDLYAVEDRRVVGIYTGGDTVGMRRAASLIVRNLKTQYNVDKSLHQADDLIREFVKSKRASTHIPGRKADVSPLVKQALDTTAAEMTHFMEDRWGNGRQFYYLLLTGGGALAVGDRIMEQYPHAIILDDPVTAAARGLAKLAQSVFSD